MNELLPAPRRPIPALLRHGLGGGDVVSRRVEGDLHRCGRAALTSRARRLANALAAAGIVPGDRVAILAWNGHRHLELAFAACGSGAILHALDPHLHPDRIAAVADDARIRMLFFDLSFMPLVEELAPRLAAGTRFIALTGRTEMPVPAMARSLLCYEDLVAGAPDDLDWPDTDDRRVAPLASRVAGHDGDGAILLPGIEPGAGHDLALASHDVVLAAVPMFDTHGWTIACSAWAAGATLVFAGPWLDGRSVHDLAESEAATIVAARPPVWQGLLAHAEREGAGLPSLRRAFVTGESAGLAQRPARMVAPEGRPHSTGGGTPKGARS